MYCSQCGQAMEALPQCPKCGHPTGIAATSAVVPVVAASKVVRHLHTLGILWVVYAIYLALHWLLLLPFLHAWMGGGAVWMTGSDTWVYAPFHPSGWLLHFIAVVVIIRVILSLLVGYAILTRQRWGRVFAIVIAILTLLKPLWGTLLAIYTLWVLLGGNAGPEYDRLALNATRPPLMSGAASSRS